MPRSSIISTLHDSAGDYETEVFEATPPKRLIVGVHGNGVRRWDGEKFFYALAEHYTDSAVFLVDQNQAEGNGCRLNPFPVMVERINQQLQTARRRYPGVPVIIIGHSMGCAVTTFLELTGVSTIVFATPATGNQGQNLIKRYGPGIIHGKAVTTGSGLRKVIPAAYYESVKDLTWEDEYRKLLSRFQPVYAFEAEQDEVVGDERFSHRDLPFAQYHIIPGAKHNLAGAPLSHFFSTLDPLL